MNIEQLMQRLAQGETLRGEDALAVLEQSWKDQPWELGVRAAIALIQVGMHTLAEVVLVHLLQHKEDENTDG